jgi:AcrR family transcriptional regulator
MNPLPSLPATERPLRADARRNREAILEAARIQVGRDGLDAQIDDIAHRAGLGVGTMYRHFPTKEALIEALTLAHFEQLAANSEQAWAAVEAGGDAWEELCWTLREAARMLAADAGLSEVVSNRPEAVQECGAVKTGLHRTTSLIMERAIADGTLRGDAVVSDIRLMMTGLGRVVSETAKAMGLSWERYVELMLDGLRARP